MAEVHCYWRQTLGKQTLALELWNVQEFFFLQLVSHRILCFNTYLIRKVVKDQMFIYWEARGGDNNPHVSYIPLSDTETRMEVVRVTGGTAEELKTRTCVQLNSGFTVKPSKSKRWRRAVAITQTLQFSKMWWKVLLIASSSKALWTWTIGLLLWLTGRSCS